MNNNNYINQMLNFISGGGSKEQFLQMFINQNQDFSKAYTFMQNQARTNNMSMKDVAINMAKQSGIDPNYLIQIAGRMGHK